MKNLASDVDTAMHTATAAPTQDTWHTMGSMSNSWHVGGHAEYKKSVYDNLLIVSFKDLVPGTVADGTVIWAAGSLPTGYQVTSAQRVSAGSDAQKANGANFEVPELEFEADGSIQCYGFSTTSTRADLFAAFPMDS
jgi:hypothetical protein